jgi:GH15 family glucan-1,4-alpha-glucosidase
MPKIEDYALLGDLHTAALVSSAGSIDWLCLPRFDSPAAFAALLDNDQAGHWALAPTGASICTSRRYTGNTLVLETDRVTAHGTVRVIDFMPPRAARRTSCASRWAWTARWPCDRRCGCASITAASSRGSGTLAPRSMRSPGPTASG